MFITIQIRNTLDVYVYECIYIEIHTQTHKNVHMYVIHLDVSNGKTRLLLAACLQLTLNLI